MRATTNCMTSEAEEDYGRWREQQSTTHGICVRLDLTSNPNSRTRRLPTFRSIRSVRRRRRSRCWCWRRSDTLGLVVFRAGESSHRSAEFPRHSVSRAFRTSSALPIDSSVIAVAFRSTCVRSTSSPNSFNASSSNLVSQRLRTFKIRHLANLLHSFARNQVGIR